MRAHALTEPRAGTLLERTGAYLLDSLVSALAWVVLVVAITRGDPFAVLEGGLEGVLAGFAFLLVPFVYLTAFEAVQASTPGKRVFGLLVVDEQGEPVGGFEATVRNVLRLAWALNPIGPLFLAIDAGLIQYTAEDQRVGDLAAGTRVVHVGAG